MLSINLKESITLYSYLYLYLFTCVPDTFTRKEEEEEEEESQEGDETMRILEQTYLGLRIASFLLHSCYVYVRTYIHAGVWIRICCSRAFARKGAWLFHSRKI